MTDVLLWVGVLALGGVGAILRTAAGATIDGRKRAPFPLGTFAVNISGAFLVGCLYGADLSGDPELLAGTALIGAYTTFSTWMADSEKLAEKGQVQIALLNVFASLLIGLGVAFTGKAVGTALF
jgi:fluoride exporter